MPLYKVSLSSGHKSHRDYTESEIRSIWLDVRTKGRMYQGNILPAYYVSTTVFLIIMDSHDFKMYNSTKDTNKVGNYDGLTVYLSRQLDSFEYYIGIEEREILDYKRIHKINKIKQRLCGHITEEKQKS